MHMYMFRTDTVLDILYINLFFAYVSKTKNITSLYFQVIYSTSICEILLDIEKTLCRNYNTPSIYLPKSKY